MFLSNTILDRPQAISHEACFLSYFFFLFLCLNSVPKSLGPIWKVQVWHDNSGPSPSWFLSRILVKDLSTQNCATFVVDKWFAVEEDDGKVEREILAADVPLPSNVVFKAKGILFSLLTEYLGILRCDVLLF